MTRLEAFDLLCEYTKTDALRKHALAVENILTDAGVDYFLQTGPYLSGLLFRTTKVGVFFYSAAEHQARARALLTEHGFKVYEGENPE